MFKHFRIALSAVFIIVFLFSTVTGKSQNKQSRNENGMIPPEFNKNNDTLLIYSGAHLYGIPMKNSFKKYYSGNFIFVNKPEKYSVETCRYILYETMSEIQSTYNTGANTTATRSIPVHDSFYILDRKTNIKYVNSNPATKKMMLEYFGALDEARK